MGPRAPRRLRRVGTTAVVAMMVPLSVVSRERAHRVPCSTGLLIALLLPAAAHAQEPNQEQLREQARQAFQQAQVHEQNERYALAAEGFLQAHTLMEQAGRPDAPIILWNAGAALAHVPGREQDAIDLIARFLSETTHLADDGDQQRAQRVRSWRSDAVSRLEELRARLAEHDDEPSEQQEEPASEETHEPEQRMSPLGPGVLGVGAATLATGLVLAVVGLVQNQDHINRCPERVACPEDLRGDVESTRTLGLVGDVLWIAGTVVAIAGLVLTLTLEEGGGDEGEHAELELRGIPGGGLVALRGRLQ